MKPTAARTRIATTPSSFRTVFIFALLPFCPHLQYSDAVPETNSDHATTGGDPGRTPVTTETRLALVLSGGGARGAYQAGVLRGLARRIPDLRFSIITGVSAGAINATFIAAHPGSLAEAAADLSDLWASLRVEDIFRV